MVEIRDRKYWQYVNDMAGYSATIPVVIFEFTLDELQAIQSWIPVNDGFYKEVDEAIAELEKRIRPLESPSEQKSTAAHPTSNSSH